MNDSTIISIFIIRFYELEKLAWYMLSPSELTSTCPLAQLSIVIGSLIDHTFVTWLLSLSFLLTEKSFISPPSFYQKDYEMKK